jgi:hypothetical protein
MQRDLDIGEDRGEQGEQGEQAPGYGAPRRRQKQPDASEDLGRALIALTAPDQGGIIARYRSGFLK